MRRSEESAWAKASEQHACEVRARQAFCLMVVNVLKEFELRSNSMDELFQEAKSSRAKNQDNYQIFRPEEN